MPYPNGDRADRPDRWSARHRIGRPLELPTDPRELETIMTSAPFAPLNHVWRHSSICQGSDATCVDVAIRDAHVAVRDSKNPHGPVLGFTFAEWQAFLLGVRAGEFELPTAAYRSRASWAAMSS